MMGLIQALLSKFSAKQLGLLGLALLASVTTTWYTLDTRAAPGKPISILGIIRYTKPEPLALTKIRETYEKQLTDMRHLIRKGQEAIRLMMLSATSRQLACQEQLQAAQRALDALSTVVDAQQTQVEQKQRAIKWLRIAVSNTYEENEALKKELEQTRTLFGDGL